MDSNPGALNVTIVGGGLGGLATGIACRRQGFNVTIYDQVKEFYRLGDSIGLGSNTSRLFYRWGIGEKMEAISSTAEEMEIYNFDNSNLCLGRDTVMKDAREKFGCRTLIGHRGDFHLILRDYCLELGVKLFMDHQVVAYDTQKPSITLASGQELLSDVVICADGAKSNARTQAVGAESVPLASGYAVFRGYMDGDLLKDDPIAGKFISQGDRVRLFVAPDMHGFVTTLRGGKEINAVLTHKDTEDVEEAWTKEGNKDYILSLLDGWDPAFKRVWEAMPSCLDWKLVYRPCLDKWVADSGLIGIMGDAAHPFLPTSVQGASQAIEDGATIAKCLAKVRRDEIPVAMHTYFAIRHDYVAAAQKTGIQQRDVWHNMHDKESKQFKEGFNAQSASLANTHLWANDAEKVVDEKWDEVSRKVRAELKAKVML